MEKRHQLVRDGQNEMLKHSLGITPEIEAALNKKYPQNGAELRKLMEEGGRHLEMKRAQRAEEEARLDASAPPEVEE